MVSLRFLISNHAHRIKELTVHGRQEIIYLTDTQRIVSGQKVLNLFTIVAAVLSLETMGRKGRVLKGGVFVLDPHFHPLQCAAITLKYSKRMGPVTQGFATSVYEKWQYYEKNPFLLLYYTCCVSPVFHQWGSGLLYKGSQ